MKKVLFILCAVAMMSFTTVDDAIECPADSSPVTSSCLSGCYSVSVLSGYLEIDASLMDQYPTGKRKPTAEEVIDMENLLQDICDILG